VTRRMVNRRIDARLRVLPLCGALLVAAALGACSNPNHRAPVEDRVSPRASTGASTPTPSPTVSTDTAAPLPGAENAGKPGYYTVKPGDTLIRIGLENGQNWKDLVKWNNLDNPNVIEVGQTLRVVAPSADPGSAGPRAVAQAKVETRPLDARPAAPAASAPPSASAQPAGPAPTPAVPPPPRDGDDDIQWAWPANGPVAVAFDEGRSKGLAIGGTAGAPVLAAADGRVVYAGSGLRGYGNLVILKHNNTYLTAYAHNQALLVKEDQAVRRGQKIAEMGSSDAERVQLHFEIRRLGKPIDPAKLLPPR